MELYPCKECIVKGVCRTMCDNVSKNIPTIMTDRHCPDCGCKECFEFIIGLQYMVCSECKSAFYFSEYLNPGSVNRVLRPSFSIKRSLKFGDSATHYNHTTFGRCMDDYKIIVGDEQ